MSCDSKKNKRIWKVMKEVNGGQRYFDNPELGTWSEWEKVARGDTKLAALWRELGKATYDRLDDDLQRYVTDNLSEEAQKVLGIEPPKPEFEPFVAVMTGDICTGAVALVDREDELLMDDRLKSRVQRITNPRECRDCCNQLLNEQEKTALEKVKEWAEHVTWSASRFSDSYLVAAANVLRMIEDTK